MGHAHDHSHGDPAQFYLEQLFTIGVCAAFAGVTLILYFSGTLNLLLAVKFHIWVLLGGAALLAMAVINGVSVWLSAGAAAPHPHAHDHDHDHAHDQAHGNGHAHDHAACDDHHHDHTSCDHHHDHAHGHDHVHGHTHTHAHEHAHAETAVQTGGGVASVQQHAAVPAAAPAAAPAPNHGHAHGDGHGHDGHDHGWAPWRYAVLLLPVAIYFLVPLDALAGPGGQAIDVDASAVSSGGDQNADADMSITFQQLELAALYSENRGYYEGKTVLLEGQYVPKDSRMFTLRRYKISCCAADAVGLNAVIVIDPDYAKEHPKEVLDGNSLQGRWVRVTGRVQFLKRADGSGGYATALILTPTKKRPLTAAVMDNQVEATTSGKVEPLVKEIPPPSNPYLN